MTIFDETMERLRALPEERKPEIAAQIALLLDDDGEDLLTPEQWEEIEARLDSETNFTPHAEVVRDYRRRSGK